MASAAEIFKEAGFHDLPGVLDAVKRKAGANHISQELAWTSLFRETWSFLDSDLTSTSLRIDQTCTVRVADVVECFRRLYEKYPSPELLLDWVLDVSTPLFEQAQLVNNLRPREFEARVACLWRARDALEAANLLWPRGLTLDAILLMRVATEALLIEEYLAGSLKRIKAFEARGAADTLEHFVRFRKEFVKFGQDVSEIDSRMALSFQKLEGLGYKNATISDSGKVKTEPAIPKALSWHTLVRLHESDEGVLGERQSLYFEPIFQWANGAAHTLPYVWSGYVRRQGESVEIVAQFDGKAGKLQDQAFLTLFLFLRRVSNMVKARYGYEALPLHLLNKPARV